jgi:fatty acid desaturase
MRITTEGRITEEPAAPLWQRLLWFAALWAGGVLAVAGIGLVLRLVLKG